MAIGPQKDFSMHRGDDKQLNFNVVDQQSPAQPIDLTGDLLEWVFSQKSPTSVTPLGDPLITIKLVGSGITIVDGPNGVYRIAVDSADTVGLVPGDYYHEFQATLAGGTVVTGFYGIMTVVQELLLPGSS